MAELKIGDIVARKSYGQDILFKVADIIGEGESRVIVLKGICYRIEADAPEDDLIVQSDQEISRHNMDMSRLVDRKFREMASAGSRNYPGFRGYPKKAIYRYTPKEKADKFSRSGKVLHIDGDKDYLDTCIEQYKRLGIEAVGINLAEKDQPSNIFKLLQEHKPDILVLTGHDGMIKGDSNYQKLDNYRNSKYFIEAVKEARRYESNPDSLVVFAGACQSLFNEIIKAGANYASAPYRILIHALDPVFVCQKIALTRFDKVLDPADVIGNTITGYEGVGGIQTHGKYRTGYPSEPDWGNRIKH